MPSIALVNGAGSGTPTPSIQLCISGKMPPATRKRPAKVEPSDLISDPVSAIVVVAGARVIPNGRPVLEDVVEIPVGRLDPDRVAIPFVLEEVIAIGGRLDC